MFEGQPRHERCSAPVISPERYHLEIDDGLPPVRRQAALAAYRSSVDATPFYAYDRRLMAEELAAAPPLPGVITLHYDQGQSDAGAGMVTWRNTVDGLDVAWAGETRTALYMGMNTGEISLRFRARRMASSARYCRGNPDQYRIHGRETACSASISSGSAACRGSPPRVNPDFELKPSGMKMLGGPKPFGMDAEQVPAVLRDRATQDLAFEGFHIFSGSQNLRADAICEAHDKRSRWPMLLPLTAPTRSRR